MFGGTRLMVIRLRLALALGVALGLAATTAHADSPPAVGAAPTPPISTPQAGATDTTVQTAASATPHVPAGTLVLIAVTDPMTTTVVKPGDKFAISLAAPVMLGDTVVIPAGVTGVGQVIDAQPSGALGKPAKLLLAARYLDFNGVRLPLHGMKLGYSGKDQTDAILAANLIPYVGILADFAHGGEITIPAGTQAVAKLGVDVPAPPPGAVVAATNVPSPTAINPQRKAP